MGKTKNLDELTVFLALSLAHRIGGRINPNAIYNEKYKKESETFLLKARKISLRENWNNDDKKGIKEKLKNKLHHELLKRDFLDNKKFGLMEEEIEGALKALNLF